MNRGLQQDCNPLRKGGKTMATFYNQATLSYNNITVSSNVVSGEITEVLTVSKTAVSDAYSPGEVLTYAVALVNSGASALTDITLTDDLGAYEYIGASLVPLTYVDGSVQYFENGELRPAPSVTAGTNLVISGITVPAGGNAMIIYQASANEFAPVEVGSAITNTVTADGTGTAAVEASATVPAENEAVLSISKSLAPCEVAENGQITYSFLIQNTGNTAESAAVISDTFDPVLSGISMTVDGAASNAYTYNELTGEFATNSGAFTVPAASSGRDASTGACTIVPGTVTVTVSGTI